MKTDFSLICEVMRSDGYSPEQILTFERLFSGYNTSESAVVDWDKIAPLSTDELLQHDDFLPVNPQQEAELYQQLVVCKLNGGLGTSMGLSVPKCSLEVRDGLSFLDITISSLLALSREHNTQIPLLLMNSPSTSELTTQSIAPYQEQLSIECFTQNFFPRLHADSLLPLSPAEYGDQAYYPPGHGDFFDLPGLSDCLRRLHASGKRYLFLSNIDNLAAQPDAAILRALDEQSIPFLMEVTHKSTSDRKGGSPVRHSEQQGPYLLEIAQVPEAHLDDFFNLDSFPYFNTNNLWFSIEKLIAVLEERHRQRSTNTAGDVIVNRKMVNGTPVIQLETAVGAAVGTFVGAKIMAVSRSRFAPVKTNADLLVLRSDLFAIRKGRLVYISGHPRHPNVRLGACFKEVIEFERRIPEVPDMEELESLIVVGDVSFGLHLCLAGQVIVYAPPGRSFHVRGDQELRDCLISPDGISPIV